MATTTDTRIASLRLDNSNFEQNAKKSLSTLSELLKASSLREAKNGFTDMSSGAQQLNGSLSNLESMVAAIGGRFTNLGIMGVTALQNITDRAINTGISIAKALTIEPLSAGLAEYENKLGSIQAILSNTTKHGTTLDDVTAALDTLNQYADQTIYKFEDMTYNVGTFTSAGITLGTAVDSIKGISNLAASLNVNSTKAAGAMYQLSQAMSAGQVLWIDWNSLNQAGLGGTVFQDAVKQTAAEMGILIDTNKSFKDSLADGWLTTDVMTATLTKFANDPAMLDAATKVRTMTQLLDTMKEAVGTGWATSWEHIFGNLEESAGFFTAIKDGFEEIIAPSTQARNEALAFWNEFGGRDAVIASLANVFNFLWAVIEPFKNAIGKLFPQATGQQLVDVSHKILAFTESIQISEEVMAGWQKLWEIALKPVQLVVKILGEIAGLLAGSVLKIFSTLYSMVGFIGGLVTAIQNTIMASEKLQYIFEKLTSVWNTFVKIGTNVRDSILGLAEAFLDFIASLADMDVTNLETFFKGIVEAFKNSFSDLSAIVPSDFFKAIFEGVEFENPFSELPKYADEAATSMRESFDRNLGVLDTFLVNLGAVAVGVWESLDGVRNVASEIPTNALASVEKLSNTLETNADTIVSSVSSFFQYIWSVLAPLLSSFKDWLDHFFSTFTFEDVLDAINTGAFVVLSSAISDFLGSTAGWTDLGDKLGGVLDGITEALTGLQENVKENVILTIAKAIALLVASLWVLSTVDHADLVSGISVISILLYEITVASTALFNALKMLNPINVAGVAGAVIGLAIAIGILSFSVSKLGKMNAAELLKGLVATIVLIRSFTTYLGVMARTMRPAQVAGIAGSIIALSIAIGILSFSVEKLAQIPAPQLVAGLIATSTLLAALGIFIDTVNVAKLGAISAPLLAIGVSVGLLALSVKLLSTIAFASLAQGIISIGIMLFMLATFTHSVNPAGLAITAGSLIGLSIAIGLLSIAVLQLGGANTNALIQGIVGVGAVLLALGLFTKLVNPAAFAGMAVGLIGVAIAIGMLIPSIVLLGNLPLGVIAVGIGAIAAFLVVLGVVGAVAGTAILALGVGMALLGASVFLAGTGLMSAALGLTLLVAIGAPLMLLIDGLINRIPALAVALAQGFIGFIETIANGIPVFIALFVAMIDGLIVIVPKIGELALVVINTLLDVLIEAIPRIVETGVLLLLSLLQGIADNIHGITQAAIEIIVGFINGIADNIDQIIDAGVNLVLSLIQGIVSKLFEIARAGLDIAGDFMDSIKNGLSGLYQAGVDAVLGLINGLGSMVGDLIQKGKDLANSALQSVKDAMGIASPSKEMAKLGRYGGQGLVVGLASTEKPIATEGKRLGRLALSAVASIMDTLNTDIPINTLTPTVRPVVDASEIQNGSLYGASLTMDANTAADRLINSNGQVTTALYDLKNTLVQYVGMLSEVPSSSTMQPVVQNTYIVDGIVLNDLETNADYTIQQLWTMTNRLGRA